MPEEPSPPPEKPPAPEREPDTNPEREEPTVPKREPQTPGQPLIIPIFETGVWLIPTITQSGSSNPWS